MERFTPKWQGKPWLDDIHALHVYLLPTPGVDDALLSLVHACRPILLEHRIDPLAGPGKGDAGTLHITVDMDASMPSAQASPEDIRLLTEALHTELNDTAPFDLELGPPIGNVAGAVLDVWPEDEFLAVQRRVRTAIRKTRGQSALQHNGGRGHMTIGSAYAARSSDELNTRLRDLTPRRATMRVHTVFLLDVWHAIAPDTGGWRIDWRPVAEIPLVP
ncbi:2'-5' RNA ligase family protein [Streptomyces sp. NPDC051572]|uniref:2'-5' RNA ligase family protein n=1 Tax=Streptomyces sp. NPDC051572 TaxID=3155802 RepID=UPI00344C62DA